jgi:hypothetical protein
MFRHTDPDFSMVIPMVRLLLLFLLVSAVVRAEPIYPPPQSLYGLSGTWTGAQAFRGGYSVGGYASTYSALYASAGAPTAGGSGYAAGDQITLSTTGGTCSTAPVVSALTVASGAVATFMVKVQGVCSVPPTGSLAQASTTGGGSGATFPIQWGQSSAGPLLGYGGNYYAGGGGTAAAGYANLVGTENTYVGHGAGAGALSGNNTALGLNAFGIGAAGVGGYALVTGGANTAVGTDCLRNVSGAAANNTCIGYGAATGNSIFTGNNITAVGFLAGGSVTTATRSTLLGASVGTTFASGSYVILIGSDTPTDTYSGGTVSAISIGGNKAGTFDTFVGSGAGGASADGNGNTAVGRQAGASWGSATYGVAVGYTAGQNATGTGATYLGGAAGLNAGAGLGQTYVGFTAGLSMSGNNSTMVGSQAGRTGTSACTSTVGVGQASLYACAGASNTGLGTGTLGALAAGANNTAIGASVGGTTCATSSGVILIGTSSAVDCPASNTSNWLNIGKAVYATLAKPTISSGFGTSPTVPSGSSSATFTVNVGTGGTANSGVILFATAAPTGWACTVTDQTNPGANKTVVSASTTTTATFSNYSQTTGLAAAWSASDVLVAQCNGY